DSRPKRVPVAGQVLIDGKPLTLGNVKFIPEGARPASGKIGEDGRFKLTTYDGGDGVVLGVHRVQVSAGKVSKEGSTQWYAPVNYADFHTSGMTFEVKEPTDSLVIELKSDGGPATIRLGG